MSLPIVFRQRFRIFIGRITNTPPQPFPGETTLAAATKFDDTNIDILFRRALNRDDALGMGDVLKKPFLPGDLKGSTKIEAVLTAIGKQASVSNVDAYRELIDPRVFEQLALVLARAQLQPVPPESVLPTDRIEEYVTATNVDYIVRECFRRLDKWLLSFPTAGDFVASETVADASNRLLARMVIL